MIIGLIKFELISYMNLVVKNIMSKIFNKKKLKIVLLNNYGTTSPTEENLMIYYRCKCGEIQAWSSMSIPDCDGCYKCKTTLAPNPELHKPLQKHEFIIKYNEDSGLPYKVCHRCWKKREQIIKEIKEVLHEKSTDKT